MHRLQVLLMSHHAEQIAEPFGCCRRLFEPRRDGGKQRHHGALGLSRREFELAPEHGHCFATVRTVQDFIQIVHGSCSLLAGATAVGCEPGSPLQAFLIRPITNNRITAPMMALIIAAMMPPPMAIPINGSSQPAMTAPIIPTTILPTSPKP